MSKDEELRRLIEKRVRTVFIGAISSIEESPFGQLKNQPEWDQAWKELRNQILNKGNDQLRLLLEEIENYSVGLKRYKYYMPTFNSREEIEAYKRGQRDSQRGK